MNKAGGNLNDVTFPLAPQMKSPQVADLHAALIHLRFKIAAAEQTAQRYGATTRAAVLQFQKAQPLPANGNVDEATAAAINARLAAPGTVDAPPPPPVVGNPTPSDPPPASPPPSNPPPSNPPPSDQPPSDPTPSDPPPANPPPANPPPSNPPPSNPPPAEPKLFSIHGEIVRPDGTPVANQIVRAYDRALCEWRRLGSAETIVRSNDRGQYAITYDPDQLRQSGKSRADLKVEVRDPSGDTVLAESPLILRALPHETVNFSLGKQRYRGPDEFTRVEKALAPQLAGHTADLACLQTPDVLILAREARVAAARAACYVKARRWSVALGVPQAVFYGLLRGGAPTRLDALLARPLAGLWALLLQARARNRIGLELVPKLRAQLAQVQQAYLATPAHPYAQLLGTTALGIEQQAAFTRRLTTGDDTGDALWQALQTQDGLSADQVGQLQQTFELQALVGDNTSLSVALRGSLRVQAAREVAAFGPEHWRDHVLTVATVEFPDDLLPGAPAAERRAAYAKMLYRQAEQRYPTASLAGQMARDAQWAGQPLLGFFAAHPTFEFSEQRVLNFLRAQPDALQGLPPTARDELLRIEQLFHLTPGEDKLTVIQPMWAAGLRAAPQLARLGRAGLVRRLPGVDARTVQRMYRQAVHVTALALSVYLRFNPAMNRLSPATLRLPQPPAPQGALQALAQSSVTLPEWQELFGSPDACACTHCESALSPSAYLVSIMAFVERAVDAAGHNALDALLARRPDLGTLQLSCENTETLVPHIDLAIEILESIVASADSHDLGRRPARRPARAPAHRRLRHRAHLGLPLAQPAVRPVGRGRPALPGAHGHRACESDAGPARPARRGCAAIRHRGAGHEPLRA
jgi:hypothetical protein